ncbi:MAG: hypothetical protein GY941_25820 [Planctomycetes bacterium]|nr:hypothetical protein [Planctomycetota bacterium]
MGSKSGKKTHAIAREKEVSIQKIPYITSKRNEIRHETGNITSMVMSRKKIIAC